MVCNREPAPKPAKLLEKWQRTVHGGSAVTVSPFPDGTVVTFWARFRTEAGETVELAVPPEYYGALHAGARGELVYRAGKLIRFTENSGSGTAAGQEKCDECP